MGFPIISYLGTIKVTMGQQITKFVSENDIIIFYRRPLPLRYLHSEFISISHLFQLMMQNKGR